MVLRSVSLCCASGPSVGCVCVCRKLSPHFRAGSQVFHNNNNNIYLKSTIQCT